MEAVLLGETFINNLPKPPGTVSMDLWRGLDLLEFPDIATSSIDKGRLANIIYFRISKGFQSSAAQKSCKKNQSTWDRGLMLCFGIRAV